MYKCTNRRRQSFVGGMLNLLKIGLISSSSAYVRPPPMSATELVDQPYREYPRLSSVVTVLGQVALQALKLCNKCCKNKEKEDDDKNKEDDQKASDDDEQEDDDDVSDKVKGKTESDSESETEERKESAPMNKKKRRAKKKRSNACSVPDVEPVTTQPFSIQTTINPVFYNTFQPQASSAIPPGLPQSGLPNGTDSATTDQSVVKWEDTSIENTVKFMDTAVVGGYDIDETDLWIIRARFKCEVIPGKLNQFHRLAFIAYKTEKGYVERNVNYFEVLCIASESRSRIRWTKCSNGVAPKNAVEAGRRASGEKLYIGRAIQEDEKYPHRHSLCPGMVQPSHGVLYVTYGFKVYAHKFYEVLCID